MLKPFKGGVIKDIPNPKTNAPIHSLIVSNNTIEPVASFGLPGELSTEEENPIYSYFSFGGDVYGFGSYANEIDSQPVGSTSALAVRVTTDMITNQQILKDFDLYSPETGVSAFYHAKASPTSTLHAVGEFEKSGPRALLAEYEITDTGLNRTNQSEYGDTTFEHTKFYAHSYQPDGNIVAVGEAKKVDESQKSGYVNIIDSSNYTSIAERTFSNSNNDLILSSIVSPKNLEIAATGQVIRDSCDYIDAVIVNGKIADTISYTAFTANTDVIFNQIKHREDGKYQVSAIIDFKSATEPNASIITPGTQEVTFLFDSNFNIIVGITSQGQRVNLTKIDFNTGC